jgi:hypothetical protein
MTNGANGIACVRKLLGMATGTRCVLVGSRHRWLRTGVLTPVTQQTRQSRVHGIVMRKLGPIACLRHQLTSKTTQFRRNKN